ncbi:histidine phosphatase family protein [Limnohabitans sp.]|uniref:histidine phosphatase family protein n=1 Tax=Limnohabitans sp. TaxID=1907725 RepID=UPI00286F7B77|nr:histidine phosphatase family protein [Limnohabitans sp.]
MQGIVIKRMALFMLGVLSCVLAQASDLSDKLQSPDHVLLMRHTLAPGVGDPANYTLADCKTQRNLSAEGRQQAVAVGDWLRQQGVKNADVRSSAWCRCKDTAQLLGFKGWQVEPTLASFFDEMHKAQAQNLRLQNFIAEKLKTKGNQPLILVTHHVNIFEFMGENVSSGDLVLAKVDTQGKMLSYQVIPRPNAAR